MSITDRRDEMDIEELLEELELRFPEKVAAFERRHPDVTADPTDPDLDPDDLDDAREDLRSLLRI